MTTPNAHNPIVHPMATIDSMLNAANTELKTHIQHKIDERLAETSSVLQSLKVRVDDQQKLIEELQKNLAETPVTRQEPQSNTTKSSSSGQNRLQNRYLKDIQSLGDRGNFLLESSTRPDFEAKLKTLDDLILNRRLPQETAVAIAMKMLCLYAQKKPKYAAVFKQLSGNIPDENFALKLKEKTDTDIFIHLFAFIMAS
jgi:hypothetical protein